jgi:hypothetical protein
VSRIYFPRLNETLELTPKKQLLSVSVESLVRRWLSGFLHLDFNPSLAFYSGFKMSQQITTQTAPTSQNWFVGIYNVFKTWVSNEIIDFDPFDEESVVTHQLFEQLLKLQNDPALAIIPDAIKS